MRNEMVVVGKNRPGFKLPAEVARDGEEAAVQDTESVRATEVVGFQIRAGCDEERSACRKLMRGCVGPRRLPLGHGETISARERSSQYRVVNVRTVKKR